jgi:hypothetical protein
VADRQWYRGVAVHSGTKRRVREEPWPFSGGNVAAITPRLRGFYADTDAMPVMLISHGAAINRASRANRAKGHREGDLGEVTVPFPGAARTTDGPLVALPRQRADLSRFREPDTDLSRTSPVFLCNGSHRTGRGRVRGQQHIHVGGCDKPGHPRPGAPARTTRAEPWPALAAGPPASASFQHLPLEGRAWSRTVSMSLASGRDL